MHDGGLVFGRGELFAFKLLNFPFEGHKLGMFFNILSPDDGFLGGINGFDEFGPQIQLSFPGAFELFLAEFQFFNGFLYFSFSFFSSIFLIIQFSLQLTDLLIDFISFFCFYFVVLVLECLFLEFLLEIEAGSSLFLELLLEGGLLFGQGMDLSLCFGLILDSVVLLSDHLLLHLVDFLSEVGHCPLEFGDPVFSILYFCH